MIIFKSNCQTSVKKVGNKKEMSCSSSPNKIVTNKRIEVVLENPNPLFVSWVEKWLKEAEERDTRSKHKLKIALDALKSFPLPIGSGRECAILRGFGPTLCKLIDKKLEEYKKDNLEVFNKSINYDIDVKTVAKKINRRRKVQQATKKGSPTKKSKSAVQFKNVNDKNDNQNEMETCTAKGDHDDEQLIISPGDFDVILLVDIQETTGVSKKKDYDETRQFLDFYKVPYEVRHLSVGDFLWIARSKSNGKELILPYIIERKRMDDFASSIRDGRFHEQKFRLRDSGIPNLIYLIESYGNNQHVGLPMSTLMQAATNTQIHNDFPIKFTDNHKNSMLYLSVFTNILKEQFKEKVLIGVSKSNLQQFDLTSSMIGLLSFPEFQENSSKNKSITVKEIFIKQLLQLKSLSVDKALAISEIYPTPKALFLAYDKCTTKDEAENLLCNIRCGKLKRPIGTYISKVIYQFYCTDFDQ